MNVPITKPLKVTDDVVNDSKNVVKQKTFIESYQSASKQYQDLYLTIKDYILSLGDDVSENQLKLYAAFKKIKNIACFEIFKKHILMHLSLDPDSVELQEDFIIDMRNKGHWGTGNVRIFIRSIEDCEKIKHLVERAYNEG